MPARFSTAVSRVLCLLLVMFASGSAPACADPTPANATPRKPLAIVCTTGMVADMVRAVAGERATVEAIMGPGVDPHLFRPTRSDVARLVAADAVFYNGLMLEGKMTDTFERLGAGGKPVVAITGAIAPEDLRAWTVDPPAEGGAAGEGADATTEHAPSHDPHLWMDPALWSRGIDTVRDRLTAIDPSAASVFAANAAAYKSQLESLDAYAKRVLGSVPERSRVLITAHDAFGYFGRRYGYQVEGIQGISTESEAGVRDIQRLVDLIVERGVKAVFVETSVSERNIKALVDGVKARTGEGRDGSGGDVAIGGSLFSDALGPADTYEGRYVGMIDHNVTTIARALGGQAPERGMAGKLAAPAK